MSDEEWTTVKTAKLGETKGARRLVMFVYHNANLEEWLNKAQLVDRSGVSRSTLNRTLPMMVKYGLFEVRGEYSNITRYRPNEESIVLSALIELEMTIRNAEREYKREHGDTT